MGEESPSRSWMTPSRGPWLPFASSRSSILVLLSTGKPSRLTTGLAGTTDGEDGGDLDDVLALLRNPEHGTSRILLLRVIERLTGRRQHDLLRERSADPELVREIHEIEKRLQRRQRRSHKRRGAK